MRQTGEHPTPMPYVRYRPKADIRVDQHKPWTSS
jgi:hypothetical protein